MLKFRTPKASESHENTSEPIISLSIRINEKILMAILTLLLSSSFVVKGCQQIPSVSTPSLTPGQNNNSEK